MSNTKMKIISNPYEQAVSFQIWDEGWIPIDTNTSPGSMLLDDDLATGFFPFKAEAIARIIIDEYWIENERLVLVFEGTDDEFEELADVCGLEEFRDAFKLERSERKLLNAREVLPEIQQILYSAKDTLCADNASNSLAELDDIFSSSNQTVPVCIMGNYSSGKSSFINALIGCEILPTGDEPITARIFQIRDSHDPNNAAIEFGYQGEHVSLYFNQDGLAQASCRAPRNLLAAMREAVDNSSSTTLVQHMNATLRYINAIDSASDIIEIFVPFKDDGVWSNSHEFTIFDTPGSNSASNKDHLRVLRKAMKDLSDGLPIYVAEYNTLDSTDNAVLFDEIATIDALDERFAMIVVNKADTADIRLSDFDDAKKDLILDWVIPKSLYAQGIYFVSSLMGLGSKIDGDFISDNSAEVYEEKERKFSDPKSRFYKTLYRFNIQPAQIAKRTAAESESCENRIFANSGLYCTERAIELFADRYSAYNKCQHVRHIVGTALEDLRRSFAFDKNNLEGVRDAQSRTLTADTNALKRKLDSCAQDINADVSKRYTLYAEKKTTCMRWLTSASKLQKRYAEPGLTPERLLQHIQDGFDTAVESMTAVVKGNSQSFLEEEEIEARTKLQSLALNNSAASEDMKRKLSTLILDFPAENFSVMEDVQFDMQEFEKMHRFLFFNLGGSGELDLKKLAATYNNEIRRAFKEVVRLVRDSHKPRFTAWLDELCRQISVNAIGLNPELHYQQEELNATNERLERLTTNLETLDACSRKITGLLEWKELL